MRRLALLAFGAAFLVLFALIAIAEGVGHPSVPAGAIAIVEGVPGDIGTVTEADLRRGLEQEVAPSATPERPEKPGDPGYNKRRDATLEVLLSKIWIQVEAEERGFTATEKEVTAELAELKSKSFKTAAEYRSFLKKAHLTPADVRAQAKLNLLTKDLEGAITEGAPKPPKDEVKAYYDEVKPTQFTTKASRDARFIVNKSRQKVEEAKALLEKDDSAASWRRVAKAYSDIPGARKNGGLQKGISEGIVEEPLSGAIFETPEAQIRGPLEAEGKFAIFEVENITPENVQPLSQVEAQIESQLTQRSQQEARESFLADYTSTWRARTVCAAGFTIERCADFESSGHPPAAPAACYEANPKGGLPAACPAPVALRSPALPGSVSVLEPHGKLMPQRPRPAGFKPVEAEE